jgi:hypothetical protein
MWNNLEEFANWYKEKGFPIRPPFEDPIYITDISYSYVLFREGQYQVELYLIKPDSETPDHSHPGIENIIMVWGGDLHTRINGVFMDYPKEFNARSSSGASTLFGMCGDKLTDKQTHAVITGAKGGALLSIEKWPERVKPTSVTVRWDGDTVGLAHNKTIEDTLI